MAQATFGQALLSSYPNTEAVCLLQLPRDHVGHGAGGLDPHLAGDCRHVCASPVRKQGGALRKKRRVEGKERYFCSEEDMPVVPYMHGCALNFAQL